MKTSWSLILVASLALAAAVPAVAGDASPADEPCTGWDATCLVNVEQSAPCGANETIGGETCVTRHAVTVTLPAGAGGATVEREDAGGHVNLLNTRNAWTSERVTVTAHAADRDARVDAERLVSSQEHPLGETGQVHQDASVQSGKLGTHASLAVQLVNGEPRWCAADTAHFRATLDCSPEQAPPLLP